MYKNTVNLSKFEYKVNYYLDDICGDKCVDWGMRCECGDTTYDPSSNRLYCCSKKNESCIIQGMHVKLSNFDLNPYKSYSVGRGIYFILF